MKILVISNNSFSDVYNNGKTLKAMFSEFRKDELCMLFFRPHDEISASACEDYFLISDKEILKSVFFPRHETGAVIFPSDSMAIKEELMEQRPKMQRTKLRQQLRDIVWKMGHWNKRKLREWIETQKPNAIFFVGSYCKFANRIAIALHKQLQIPMAVYYTDDYVVNAKPSIYRNSLIKSYQKLIEECEQFYAIGEEMADAYAQFFGKRFNPIMNIVDKSEPCPKQESTSITISYFGSLYYKRFDAIVKIAQLLNDRKTHIKKMYSINIYTSSMITEEQKIQLEKFGINSKGFVKGDEFKNAMKATDIFLHVESDDEDYIRLVKLSVSTKIPEYLMAYRPTIAFGPKEVASIRLYDKIDSRMVVFSNDKESLDCRLNRIIQLINDSSLRDELAQIGFDYACKHYIREVVARQFKNSLIKMINEPTLNMAVL